MYTEANLIHDANMYRLKLRLLVLYVSIIFRTIGKFYYLCSLFTLN